MFVDCEFATVVQSLLDRLRPFAKSPVCTSSRQPELVVGHENSKFVPIADQARFGGTVEPTETEPSTASRFSQNRFVPNGGKLTVTDAMPKGAPEKTALAWWLRERTTVPLRWVG